MEVLGALLVPPMSIKDHSLLAILDMSNSAKHIFGIMKDQKGQHTFLALSFGFTPGNEVGQQGR